MGTQDIVARRYQSRQEEYRVGDIDSFDNNYPLDFVPCKPLQSLIWIFETSHFPQRQDSASSPQRQ